MFADVICVESRVDVPEHCRLLQQAVFFKSLPCPETSTSCVWFNSLQQALQGVSVDPEAHDALDALSAQLDETIEEAAGLAGRLAASEAVVSQQESHIRWVLDVILQHQMAGDTGNRVQVSQI